jgi:copper chaperone CopZ
VALEGIDGVDRVRVNFTMKTATVTLKPGASLSKEACDAVFENTPYGVSSLDQISP